MSLVVRAFILLLRLPEGRRVKRLCCGCVLSLMMLWVLLMTLVMYMSSCDGKATPQMSCAVFITRWLESLPVPSSAVSIPNCDGASDDTLHCTSVEVAEDFR